VTVADVIRYAKSSVLNQLAVKDNDNTLIDYINLAVEALNQRYQLRTEEQVINLVNGQMLYALPAESIKVLAVYDEAGDEIPLNDEKAEGGVFTPSHTTLQVPWADDNLTISLLYLSTPEPVALPEDTVPVPPQMLYPILEYMGFMAHSAIDGTLQTENNVHYQRFEAACNDLERFGLLQEDVTPDDKFSIRGFC